MLTKKLSIAFVISLCIMMLVGCSGPAAPAPDSEPNSSTTTPDTANAADPTDDGAAEEPLKIGVTFKSIKQEFDVTMKAGVEETAKALGAEIVVVDANFDMTKQIAAVDDFITQKVDAIIMSPVNSTGCESMIQSAQEAGIPVITIDIGTDTGVERCYVASDNLMGGRIIAEYLTEDLGVTSGKAVILDLKEDISVRERCQGFMEVLEKYPDIEVVAHMDGGGNRAESLAIAESVIQGTPDADIIFGGIGDMVVGVGTALRAADYEAGDVNLVGYDADYDVLKEIESGYCKGITAQFPFEIGKTAVETALALKNGEDVPEKIAIPVEVVSPDNLGDFLVEK